jgi:hypothetical protein
MTAMDPALISESTETMGLTRTRSGGRTRFDIYCTGNVNSQTVVMHRIQRRELGVPHGLPLFSSALYSRPSPQRPVDVQVIDPGALNAECLPVLYCHSGQTPVQWLCCKSRRIAR